MTEPNPYTELDAAVVAITTEAAEAAARGATAAEQGALTDACARLRQHGLPAGIYHFIVDAGSELVTMEPDDLRNIAHESRRQREDLPKDTPAERFWMLVGVAALVALRHQEDSLTAAEVDVRWGGHLIEEIVHEDGEWLPICFCEQDTDWQPTRQAAVEDGRRHLVEHGCDPDNFDLSPKSD